MRSPNRVPGVAIRSQTPVSPPEAVGLGPRKGWPCQRQRPMAFLRNATGPAEGGARLHKRIPCETPASSHGRHRRRAAASSRLPPRRQSGSLGASKAGGLGVPLRWREPVLGHDSALAVSSSVRASQYGWGKVLGGPVARGKLRALATEGGQVSVHYCVEQAALFDAGGADDLAELQAAEAGDDDVLG